MATAGKLIDVLITAYNAQATLPSAIASIQRQTVRDIGIIVVDDGSTDGSAAILAEIAADDPRVRIVTTTNGGIVTASNIGLAHTDAEFVARFDADDIAFPDRLAKQLDFLRRNDRHVAVGGNVWHIDADGNRLGTRSRFAGEVHPDPAWAPSREPYLLHPFLMARRDAMMRIGYRYVFHAEDTDLCWRLLELGGLHNLPDLLGEYRRHSTSITSASIVNGRISAINSQLAAVSANRRRRGEEDLVFDASMLDRSKDRRETRAILDLWADRLTPSERRYLDVAVAAKLLELAAYRPYELEIEDCRFIRRAFARNVASLSAANTARIGATLARTLFRLAKTRHFAEAAILAALKP